MKLILTTLFVVATVVLTAGLYLAIRKPDQKKSDLEKLQSLPSRIVRCIQNLGDYLLKRFGAKPEATTDQSTAESNAPAA